MACALKILSLLRSECGSLETALKYEYRFTARSMEYGDFLEGIRAAIIDKDRMPNWRNELHNVPSDDIEKMLAPLGSLDLQL